MSFQLVLIVGFGGFCGSILRFLISTNLSAMTETHGLATWIINILGSLLIGIALGYGQKNFSPELVTVITVGFLGGFTTFSAFSAESLQFIKEGRIAVAAFYAITMISLGIAAAAIGLHLSSK